LLFEESHNKKLTTKIFFALQTAPKHTVNANRELAKKLKKYINNKKNLIIKKKTIQTTFPTLYDCFCHCPAVLHWY